MNSAVDQWIDAHKEEIISTLQQTLRFRSIEGAPLPGAPYGQEVADCLEDFLKKAEAMGFSVKNLDGHAGYIDAGQGEEMMGILGHLDVVPEGNGWTHPPYGGEIADGRIYGRGTLDDKGPMVASLYAVRAIQECGIPFHKRVRLILGCNEETGMKCLDYYKEHAEIPDFSISPDGRFPMTSSEKSMAVGEYRAEFRSNIKVYAGLAHNSVPGEAFAEVNMAEETVQTAWNSLSFADDFGLRLEKKDEALLITVIGQQTHAANPHEGKNALQALLNLIAELPLEADDAIHAKALRDLFHMEYYGESFGLDKEDASGRFTLNVAIMDWKENGYTLTLDVRVPLICLDEVAVKNALYQNMKKAGAEVISWSFDKGYCIPDDSELVTKVLHVFHERTGVTDAVPHHIGGGTYSRKLPNAVSFGPERYMCESLDHNVDEFIGVDQLMFLTKIYADAIMALCTE